MATYANIRIPAEIVIPVRAEPAVSQDGLSATVVLVPDYEAISIHVGVAKASAVPTTDPTT